MSQASSGLDTRSRWTGSLAPTFVTPNHSDVFDRGPLRRLATDCSCELLVLRLRGVAHAGAVVVVSASTGSEGARVSDSSLLLLLFEDPGLTSPGPVIAKEVPSVSVISFVRRSAPSKKT